MPVTLKSRLKPGATWAGSIVVTCGPMGAGGGLGFGGAAGVVGAEGLTCGAGLVGACGDGGASGAGGIPGEGCACPAAMVSAASAARLAELLTNKLTVLGWAEELTLNSASKCVALIHLEEST